MQPIEKKKEAKIGETGAGNESITDIQASRRARVSHRKYPIEKYPIEKYPIEKYPIEKYPIEKYPIEKR
ncbi:hypothetical protein E4U25_003879 [Claviceps purpurea]|nr:hypothetical protein E4U25_003879 [Claviceps purpurea]